MCVIYSPDDLAPFGPLLGPLRFCPAERPFGAWTNNE